MSDRATFEAALEELTLAHDRQTSLYAPFLRILPIDGAAISTFGPPFGTETISASDAVAARADELQIDLGEGPAWDALASKRPVLVSDLRSTGSWPAFRNAIAETAVVAVYAFPLSVGSINIGALDLYSRQAGALTRAQVTDAVLLASIVARQVLRSALSSRTDRNTPVDEEGHSRRIVHQATGMVLAQLNLSAVDALLVIHGHAFSHGRPVRDIAADVVARKLDFSPLAES